MADSFAILGDPALNRTRLFADAVRAAGAEATLVPYAYILLANSSARAAWPCVLAGRRIRIESPGRDFDLERALLLRGARVGVEPRFSRWSEHALETLRRDPGLIFAGRQWYLGWRDLLAELAVANKSANPGRPETFLNHPDDIAVMFDKTACHARLATAGVPVPPALAPPASFDDLASALDASGRDRIFLKPAHGSAAGGVVALARQGDDWHAATAVELAGDDEAPRLYATRRLRAYRDVFDVRRLVDALCREHLHVEAWVPKAGLGGRTFDVRVVVIDGRARHLLPRLALGPITNLHLDATKGTEAALRERAGPAAITLLRETAERAAACFPRSLCMGVDLALTPDFRRAFVLEVNAFGDLLEGVLWEGADTYACEVRAALRR